MLFAPCPLGLLGILALISSIFRNSFKPFSKLSSLEISFFSVIASKSMTVSASYFCSRVTLNSCLDLVHSLSLLISSVSSRSSIFSSLWSISSIKSPLPPICCLILSMSCTSAFALIAFCFSALIFLYYILFIICIYWRRRSFSYSESNVCKYNSCLSIMFLSSSAENIEA